MTILVLDIGSSSARALLFDDNARLIPGAQAAQAYQFETEPPGASTLDADTLRAHVESCIDRILLHPDARTIRVVGVDTLVGNVLGIDADGRAVTPIYTYADTRSAHDVDLLRQQVDADDAHQRTGCLLHTAYHPARLHWLRRTDPALFERVDRWVDLGAYLYGNWFAQMATSYSVASWSGLLNRESLTWDATWLDALAVSHGTLPALRDYHTFVRGLTAPYAARWHSLQDVPFCLPIGDGVAANIGSGCVDANSIALTVGTTAALRTVTDDAVIPVPRGLWCYRVDAAHRLVGGATSEGGNVFQWIQETLRLPGPRETESALSARAPDEHGLTFLPLMAGERSPGWSTDATGAVSGLRLSTTPLDILQAALEGVAHRLALVHEQLQPVAAPDARIVASGGALTASPVWAQIIANALNCPLNIIAEAELTARGTAILALRAIDAATLDNYPPTIQTIIRPQPERAAQMRRARLRQVALYETLIKRS